MDKLDGLLNNDSIHGSMDEWVLTLDQSKHDHLLAISPKNSGSDDLKNHNSSILHIYKINQFIHFTHQR